MPARPPCPPSRPPRLPRPGTAPRLVPSSAKAYSSAAPPGVVVRPQHVRSGAGDAASPDSSISRGSVTVPPTSTGSKSSHALGPGRRGRRRRARSPAPRSRHRRPHPSHAATLRRNGRTGARTARQDGAMAKDERSIERGGRVPRRPPRRRRSPTSSASAVATGRAPTPTAPTVASWWCASGSSGTATTWTQTAAAWAGPELPIPEVLAVGDAFDGAFAISVAPPRAVPRGRRRRRRAAAGAALERLLRGVPRGAGAAGRARRLVPAGRGPRHVDVATVAPRQPGRRSRPAR